MSNAIPIYRESNLRGERETFYVPYFQVKIANRDLPDDVLNDVLQVTYKDKVDDLDSFELTVNNWDAHQQRFKYEPAETPFRGMFDPGQRIELHMGYVQNLRQMLVGEITTVQPNYPETGSSTLTVSGLNILHGLRKKQHTYAWYDRTDSWIADWMGKQPISDNQPGLNIRVETPSAGDELAEPFVFMHNQYDIVFLLARARRKGYTLRLELGQTRNGQARPDKLVFGPSEALRDVTYELEWGKTLTSFRPTLQTANQIAKVTVRGWDRSAKRAIEGTAQLPRDACSNNDWQSRIARAVNGRHEEITDQPVRTRQEAQRLAKKILCDQSRQMITANGATVGLPDLRAGRKVIVLGFGARRVNAAIVREQEAPFDGEYFITETTHTINEQGYRTTFVARREGGVP